jgi:hypothetical protein
MNDNVHRLWETPQEQMVASLRELLKMAEGGALVSVVVAGVALKENIDARRPIAAMFVRDPFLLEISGLLQAQSLHLAQAGLETFEMGDRVGDAKSFDA